MQLRKGGVGLLVGIFLGSGGPSQMPFGATMSSTCSAVSPQALPCAYISCSSTPLRPRKCRSARNEDVRARSDKQKNPANCRNGGRRFRTLRTTCYFASQNTGERLNVPIVGFPKSQPISGVIFQTERRLVKKQVSSLIVGEHSREKSLPPFSWSAAYHCFAVEEDSGTDLESD